MFITSGGHAKILDFGLAKLLEPQPAVATGSMLDTAAATTPGVVLGTVGYMAPEQVRGQAEYNENYGRFSPDGWWIIYTGEESGRPQVYVVPFPGRGGKWQVSTAGGCFHAGAVTAASCSTSRLTGR